MIASNISQIAENLVIIGKKQSQIESVSIPSKLDTDDSGKTDLFLTLQNKYLKIVGKTVVDDVINEKTSFDNSKLG